MKVFPDSDRNTPTHKFLFLDFDGVLHPNNASPSEWFCRMPLLEAAVGTQVIQIVVSSSWRFHHAKGELIKHFPPKLRSQIVGVTGPPVIGKHARWNEILTYVKLHHIRNWRALDDSHFEFPHPCDQLIACDGAHGLKQKQQDELEDWLD